MDFWLTYPVVLYETIVTSTYTKNFFMNGIESMDLYDSFQFVQPPSSYWIGERCHIAVSNLTDHPQLHDL